MRSKDGVNWVTDPGEAYQPGVSFHENGKVEEWFKYEIIDWGSCSCDNPLLDKYKNDIVSNYNIRKW